MSLRRPVRRQRQGDDLFHDLSIGRAGVHDDGVAEFGVRGQGYRRSVLCPTSLPAVCRFTFVKEDRSKPLFDRNMAEIALVLRLRRSLLPYRSSVRIPRTPTTLSTPTPAPLAAASLQLPRGARGYLKPLHMLVGDSTCSAIGDPLSTLRLQESSAASPAVGRRPSSGWTAIRCAAIASSRSSRSTAVVGVKAAHHGVSTRWRVRSPGCRGTRMRELTS